MTMNIKATSNDGDNKESPVIGVSHDADKAAGHRHTGKCCNCSKSSCKEKSEADPLADQ
jgi:hypothetical protein